MEFLVKYKVEDKFNFVKPENAYLGGAIGARMDLFIEERVSGRFAIEEILRESEYQLRDRYDDQVGGKGNCLWRSEFWGKLMLGAVRVCRLKGDSSLKEAIRKSVYRVLSYQDSDGYLCTYKDKDLIFAEDQNFFNWNVWGRKYILWALCEAAMLLDDAYVLSSASKLLDHLMGQLKAQGYTVREVGVIHGLPASSILKPVLLLYRLTKDEKYLEFAKGIVKDLDREDGAKPNLIPNALSGKAPADWYPDEPSWCAKAYEMMSCFDGLIEYYRITGEERIIEASKSFFDILVKYESNVLGSVGYNEWFFNAADYPDAASEVCDVIHWMRLCHELYKVTGDAKYMDAFEKAFLNAFLAGIYDNGKDSTTFVRSSGRHLTLGVQCGSKYQHCCVNNVARGFVNAAESAVAEGEDGYYINTYYETMSVFGKRDILINSGYLTSGTVLIKVRNMDEGDNIYLRIPEFSKNTKITYGESGVEHEADPAIAGEYLKITLEGGDTLITVNFDMTPRVKDFKGEFKVLAKDDYHLWRWIDPNGGFCDRELMVKHPMSVISRGQLLLARSKRLGDNEADMFSGETINGKSCEIEARNIYTPGATLLSANVVTLRYKGKERVLRMCDYASSANFNSLDERFFTVNV